MSADPQAPEYKESIGQSADERTRQPVPALRARAGVTGHNVRYVLAFGLDRCGRGISDRLSGLRLTPDPPAAQSLRSANQCLALPTSAAETGAAELPQALRI